MPRPPNSDPEAWTLRRWILGILLVGLPGTAAELVLLGHYEDPWQWVPLVLLGVGLVVVTVAVLRPGRRSLAAVTVVGLLSVLAGALGVFLHYRGNMEFEREIYPTMAGLELVRESLTGATPALAPGGMALLGLLMLAYAFRHPLRGGAEST